MRKAMGVAIGIAIAVAGCSSAPIKLDKIRTEQRLRPYDAVAIFADVDPTRTDRLITVNMHNPTEALVETGPIWKRGFIGDADGDIRFSVISSQIEYKIEAAGFVGRCTYVIDGELAINGNTRFPIHAEGSRAAGMNMGAALKQSIELGVLDAAKQADALLKKHRATN